VSSVPYLASVYHLIVNLWRRLNLDRDGTFSIPHLRPSSCWLLIMHASNGNGRSNVPASTHVNVSTASAGAGPRICSHSPPG
jgi:hypothetical protein